MNFNKYSDIKIQIWPSEEEKDLKEFLVKSVHKKKHVSPNVLKLIYHSRQ